MPAATTRTIWYAPVSVSYLRPHLHTLSLSLSTLAGLTILASRLFFLFPKRCLKLQSKVIISIKPENTRVDGERYHGTLSSPSLALRISFFTADMIYSDEKYFHIDL